MPEPQEAFYKSINLNADSDFPYLMLEVINGQSFPPTPAFRIMHWHEDLQFVYVQKGVMTMRTLAEAVEVGAGEGLFVNKGVLHRVEKLAGAHYRLFRFPDYFLGFYLGSPARALVDKVLAAGPSLLHFRPGADGEALRQLARLSALEDAKAIADNALPNPLYAYEVMLRLAELFLGVCRRAELPDSRPLGLTGQRMQKILRYIEQHYPEEISLEDLAASANVSKSECLRCFRQTMQTTPYKYLVEYRLLRAALLLKNTQDSVGEIAARVGFRLTSHFGRCFREKTGLTPREYRQKGSIASYYD